MSETGLLRIKLSAAVSSEQIAGLRGSTLADAPPGPCKDLMQQARVVSLKPVYELSEDEASEDKYGFAREFSLAIEAGADLEAAADLLAKSVLVEEVRPVGLRRVFDGA